MYYQYITLPKWVLFFFLLLFANADTLENRSDWSIISQNGYIKYSVHGNRIYGHQFGFLKKISHCDDNILWITWSGLDNALSSFEGQDIIIEMTIGDLKKEITTSLLAVSTIGTTKVLLLSNVFVDRTLIEQLHKSRAVHIQIISPLSLVQKLDITADIFDVTNILNIEGSAQKKCLQEQIFFKKKISS